MQTYHKYLLFRRNRKTKKLDAYSLVSNLTFWSRDFGKVLYYRECSAIYRSAIRLMKKDYEFFIVRLGSKKSKMSFKWLRHNTWTTENAYWKLSCVNSDQEEVG
jgi:hypothetical protein